MGKAWDDDKGGSSGWIAWMTEVMRQCHRVLKPGAHGLVWAIPRTSHWTATALEDAGFEVRDVITHLFGQGFPKSLDISKAIDKAAGAEREVVGVDKSRLRPNRKYKSGAIGNIGGDENDSICDRSDNGATLTAPATDAAKQWQGWGTALKPASEHWILVRKPCSEKTVAANVLKWGTGGINVDGCRVESGADYHELKVTQGGSDCGVPLGPISEVPRQFTPAQGRFPANLVLSHSPYCTDEQCDIECAIKALDKQSGMLKSGAFKEGQIQKPRGALAKGAEATRIRESRLADFGGASRFFYCAKISPSERGEGNSHPTVKPQKLMRYLCRLITPPAGTVLDPFMGSGSTGIAAKAEGFGFIGIERDSDYFSIASQRITKHLDRNSRTELA